MSEKVNVAIRVRPFNRREIDLNTQNVVEVSGDQTILNHPSSKDATKSTTRHPKVFAFDHCFWSFNESDAHFASQEIVYNELGKSVLESSFQGYNACIFAYGQTGSGKSYTMMGSPNDKGLIPRLCDAIFETIAIYNDPDTNFKVEVSYMEIYNEKVHDLLDPKGTKHNLKVREHNILGPYVDGLSTLAVSSFKEIDNLMTEGNKSRTVAATNMNSESSRSHAVFTITLTCTVFDPIAAVSGEKVSKMSLVDLAGSERAIKSGAVGERLKEGGNINKSLTTLGLVISKLADQSSGKTREQFVPYRDSVLTWLLKDNLGGNSKTIMVATISPASDNYEETLSTLRYADRAKRIVNHAVINEDPNARIIRELREEVDQLKELLKNATQQGDLYERLRESEKLIKEREQTWEEKLRKTEVVHQERQQALEKMGISVQGSGIKVETAKFYLVNLNADPSLNELLVYYLKERTLIGRCDAPIEQDIQLSGIGIMPKHCIIELDRSDNSISIIPLEGARTYVNGLPIKDKTSLKHGDRILWGNNHFFRLNCPKTQNTSSIMEQSQTQDQLMDYEFAREELMMNELMNDPIQGAMKALEMQHEEDKQNALEKQRVMYEKQIQKLRSTMSPSTPYPAYSYSFDAFGRTSFGGSTSNLTSPSVASKMEKWEQERDELFKKSLAKLREDIVRVNQMANEANLMADEMGKFTEFKVTLQIPAANLSPNRKRGAFVSEPALVVRRKNRASQIWSMDKFEMKLIDMRDFYQEWKSKDTLDSSADNVSYKSETDVSPIIDPFYESQENHHLIGVANIFLEVLFHDVILDYHVPIISQQGEVSGRLHCEIGRISGHIGERIADASQDNQNVADNDQSIAENKNQIVIRVSIKSAKGLPQSLSNYIFCQYSFWGCNDAIVAPFIDNDQYPVSRREKEDMTFRFDHTKEFTTVITEEFLEHCADGALSIEVWGHRSVGFSTSKPGWELADAQMEMSRSLADRWAELKRKIALWVEIQELNEQGEYSPVEVIPKPDNPTGGIYQLRQGQQRRIAIRVEPVQDSGTLPVICEAITSLAIGCVYVRSKLQKPLDSYQEEDLSVLRDKWSEALKRRQEYLNDQIKQLINKTDKSKEDLEREQSLLDQWVSLTEERNAVNCPPQGSNIPGALADWEPPPGVEHHIPVIFLDLNPDDMSLSNIGDNDYAAGSNSIIPKEHSNQFVSLPIVDCGDIEADVSAVGVWDSSMHQSQNLNRVTQPNERIYLILKASVRLSHPAVMDLVLRKRLSINIYKKQSFTGKLLKKIVRSDCLTSSGVIYEIVSCIPKASEDPEDRETLALMAASGNDLATCDGESYIEKYTKGVSAVESILSLDRLRQEVTVRELLSQKGKLISNPEALIRKTASVPNMAAVFGQSNISGSNTKLDKSDSAFDLTFLASAYKGFDIRHYFGGRTASTETSSNTELPPKSNSTPNSKVTTPTESLPKHSFGPVAASPISSMSPHSAKMVKPMRTLIEEQFSRDDPTHEAVNEDEEECDTIDDEHHNDDQSVNETVHEKINEEHYENERFIDIEKTDNNSIKLNTNDVQKIDDQSVPEASRTEKCESLERDDSKKLCEVSQSSTRESLVQNNANNAGTPSLISSGYGSQPLSGTPVSSEDSLSLNSAHDGASQDETSISASNNDISVIERLNDSDSRDKSQQNHHNEENTSKIHLKIIEENLESNNCDHNNKVHLENHKHGYSSDDIIVNKRVNNDGIKEFASHRSSYPLLNNQDNVLHVPSQMHAESASDNESTCSYDSRCNDGPSALPDSSATVPDWIIIGESVRISPDSKTGVVAYIGKTNFASGIWIGVELDTPTGKNDGSVNGTVYFTCKPRYGIFVKPEKLKVDQRGRTLRAVKPIDNGSNDTSSLSNNSISQSQTKTSAVKSAKRR